jgi:hypothetical protein
MNELIDYQIICGIFALLVAISGCCAVYWGKRNRELEDLLDASDAVIEVSDELEEHYREQIAALEEMVALQKTRMEILESLCFPNRERRPE